MTQDIDTTQSNIVTLLTQMTTPGTTPMFDDVILGQPYFIPQGNRRVATVQPVEEYDFEETNCATHYSEKASFYINLESAGTSTIATHDIAQITAQVKTAVKTTPTFMGACMGSTVNGVRYGEMAGEQKRLTAVSRIELVCDYAY